MVEDRLSISQELKRLRFPYLEKDPPAPRASAILKLYAVLAHKLESPLTDITPEGNRRIHLIFPSQVALGFITEQPGKNEDEKILNCLIRDLMKGEVLEPLIVPSKVRDQLKDYKKWGFQPPNLLVRQINYLTEIIEEATTIPEVSYRVWFNMQPKRKTT